MKHNGQSNRYVWHIESKRVQQTSKLVTTPLWTTRKSFSAPDECGWLFLGAGSPWVAHLVWAIPAWIGKESSKFKFVAATSGRRMQSLQIKDHTHLKHWEQE